MLTLTERVTKTLHDLVMGKEVKPQKDIYFQKVLLAPAHESIFVSFRFHNKNNNYFTLSFMVQLKEVLPVVSCVVCQLDPRRFFIRHLKSFKSDIPKVRQIPAIMDDPHVRSHYVTYRQLPVALLYDEYVNQIKDDVVAYLETLEEVKLVW